MSAQSTNLELKSINALLSENFYIPAYQRGYRWSEQQVVDLLNDILEFSNDKHNDGEFYCLQPIVVKKRDNESWELIDGQQRLTTLYILLSYLSDISKILFSSDKKYSLEFETRKDSKDFLENRLTELNDTNIDFYYMSNTYQYIKNWFESNEINKADFLNTLRRKDDIVDGENRTNNVRVIWYETEQHTDSIAIFTRLNMGKIPLTNAELVKALLLSSNNLQKSDDYIRVKQLEISSSWDYIENKLQDDEFWYFLNPQINTIATRIEFIFDMMASDYNNSFEEKYKIKSHNNEYFTFMVFNQYINLSTDKEKILEVFDEIKRYFMTFEEWFEDRELFHYIGYLSNNQIEIKTIKSNLKNLKKSEFKNYLKALIRDDKALTKVAIQELSYEDDYKPITKILFLFNVISTLDSKSKIRFSFKEYINGKWSLEHIHAQNSEELKTDIQRKEWLSEHKDFDFKDISVNEKILKLLKQKDIKESFEVLQKKIFEEHSDSIDLHSIDNLALLSVRDNSSLNNSIFPKKRDKIMRLDEDGSFIPICTKNVFLKYYSKNVDNFLFWNKSDRKDYLDEIKMRLRDFLVEEAIEITKDKV